MPGVNAPNDAGVPSVSASVAGTVPPTVPSWPAVEQVAIAVFDGSLSEVAVSVTEPVALEVHRAPAPTRRP